MRSVGARLLMALRLSAKLNLISFVWFLNFVLRSENVPHG